MAKGEYISFMTPVGIARYPKLEKQDVYEGEEVGFKCGMTFDNPKDWAVVKKSVNDAAKKLANGKKVKGTIIRTDKDGNEYIELKSYKAVPLFGRKAGQKLPEGKVLGGGSLVRLDGVLTFKNGYITGYLNAVQVAKLVEKGSGGQFDDLDGYEEDDNQSSGGSKFDTLPDDEDDDDEIPF